MRITKLCDFLFHKMVLVQRTADVTRKILQLKKAKINKLLEILQY